MFNFKEDKLTTEQIMDIANADGLPALRVAINANGYRLSSEFWGVIDTSEVYQGEALAVLIDIIAKGACRSKGVIGVRYLYESARKRKPFAGVPGVMDLIKDVLVPALDKMNLTCLIGDKIYLHPSTLEPGWQSEFKGRRGIPYHLRYTEAEVEEAMEVMRKVKDITEWLNSTNC